MRPASPRAGTAPPTRPRTGTPGVSPAARVRAWVAAGVVGTLLAGVGYKAYAVQVVDGDRLRDLAVRQHVHTVQIPAPRGPILDARGRPLAVSADAESVFANPRAVTDVAATAERLAAATGTDVNTLEARLASKRHFAWVARHVTPEQAAAVRALGLPGVEVTHEPRRWYPGRSIGGPVLGIAGIDGDGLDGLELHLDGLLRGERARFSAVRDVRGKTTLSDGLIDATPGATVQLTLDRAVQDIADQALAAAIAEHRAHAGSVVVLDVATGGVLALASWPTYDSNDPGHAAATHARNRAVTDSFEIGSIMKVFTVSAAIDAGLVTPDTLFDVEGGRWHWKPGRKPVTDTHHDQQLTVAGIVKRSSNVGAAKIGMRLGGEALAAGLRRFGFGARTGIDLPGEQPGRVRDGSTWRDVELITISFGYGVTVTPIQVAAALAAIGNHGVYHPPRVVERITDAAGTELYRRPADARQIMKPSTADAMLPILASVFERGRHGGTAGSVDVPGFAAGGKTATAYKYDPALHRYADDRYLSSFAGLAPIANPRIAVVVVVDEPSAGKHYGGQVAGPVFGTVVSQTLRYLGVPGDGPAAAPGHPASGGPAAAAAVPPVPRPPAAPLDDPDDGDDGDDGDDRDDRDEGAPPPSSDDRPLATTTIPDFRGLGVGRALAAARAAGLDVVVTGSGRCTSQAPPAGPGPAGAVVMLTFSDEP